MIDLKDCTFLIPVYIDSEDRANNLKLIIKYLTTHFDTNIFIGEQKNLKCVASDYIKHDNISFYQFDFGDIDFFHYSGIFNRLAIQSKTKCIAVYDTDVLFPKNQIERSYLEILNDKSDMVYPYDGNFYEVKKIEHNKIFESLDLFNVNLNNCKLCNSNSYGGCVFFNRRVFIEGGMSNENIIKWGYEDNERFIRFERLGYNLCRVTGPLFHLEHTRKANTPYYGNDAIVSENAPVFQKLLSMTKEELKQEIKTWSWVQNVK